MQASCSDVGAGADFWGCVQIWPRDLATLEIGFNAEKTASISVEPSPNFGRSLHVIGRERVRCKQAPPRFEAGRTLMLGESSSRTSGVGRV